MGINPSPPLMDRLGSVPERPGVYIFKDGAGRYLYVGKAGNLRARLRAYSGAPQGMPPKTARMVQRARDLEFLLTDSESEALILENTLIKLHRPPFNAQLRDDKTYPYIRIDLREEYPLVYFTRRVARDGARYYGPFASASSVRKTLDLLKRLFPYRSCTKAITGGDPRPCLEYFIHRCVAPCTGYATREQYREVIDHVAMFLEGKTAQVLRQLRSRMARAAEAMEFERAARLRDQIRAIQQVGEEQKAASAGGGDMDVVALAQEHDEARAEVFFVRQGKLVGRDGFMMDGARDEAPGRLLGDFIQQFYDRASFVPPLVLLQHPPEEAALLAGWLSQRRGGPVALRVPQRGEKRRMVAMVAENASQGLAMGRARRLSTQDALQGALREVEEALGLPRPPRRVECYDISNVHGADSVGSMVVFQDGLPAKAHYRRFRVKTVEGIDDYAMMREVLKRRFSRLAGRAIRDPEGTPDGQPWGVVPDLVLIDGGRGHLSSAQQVFLELGLSTEEVPLASLAKQEEAIFVPHDPEPIVLPRGSQGLFLVQRVRDEAHRFAVEYHRRLRSRRQVRSGLDSVHGIGPKRRKALLLRFGGVRGVKEASPEEIAAIPGMTMALARRLKEQL